MKLIVGLGNPGKKYTNTRHNVGFQFLDKLVEKLPVSSHISKRMQVIYYLVEDEETGSTKALLAKPQTFMNRSGNAVRLLMDTFKISLDELVVVHDDIDLPLGTYKISYARNSAGHKGVQSIIDSLSSYTEGTSAYGGSSKNFRRIRLGVNRPPLYIPAEKYVLQRFSKEEGEQLNSVVDALVLKVLKVILEGGDLTNNP